MPNDLDDLMDLDVLSLSQRSIEDIIAYYRNLRSGPKPKKDTGPKVQIDLVKLGLKKEAEPVKRRI